MDHNAGMDSITLHNQGVTLRKAERFEEALACFDGVIARGAPRPETRLMRAHVLGDLGRFDEAVLAYRAVLDERPDFIDGHETLSRLLPQIGRGDEALASYEAALVRAPHIGMLWMSALGTAQALERPQAMLAIVRVAEERFGRDAMLGTYTAVALSKLGQDMQARDLLASALAQEADYQPAHLAMAHVLIRLGDWQAAATHAQEAARLAPHDQSAWALLSVAWRLLDDAREDWLIDYEAHVLLTTVVGIDWLELAANLTARHRTMAHPADQSLRGGTQTRGTLFESPDPLVQALKEAIRTAIRGQIGALPHDPAHPFLSRNSGDISFPTSWSVRLRGAGFHVSHIHPEGWLSSALYIALPPEVGEGDAGTLAFGVPDAALGLDLPPRRIVRPRVGQLVLFPSFVWHGTVPFQSDQPRMTVAFDAVPA
jgi:tetratricopeptide (TPR) repeat protein